VDLPFIKKLASHILISLFSIAIFLALSEAILGLAGISPKNENLYFLLNPELSYPRFFQRDHYLFWKFRPNQIIKSDFFVEGEYRICSSGLRNQEFSREKPDGVFRIICLGNSNTFGWKQAEKDAYPQRLQELCGRNPSGLKIEVINAGITGYSSYQGKLFLKNYILKLKPDLVLVNYGWNDLLPAKFGIEDKDQKMPPQWILDIQNILSRTTLYQILKSFWVGRFSHRQEKRAGVPRVSLQNFQSNLIEIGEICKQNRVSVLFLTNPIAYLGPGKTSRVHPVNQSYNNIIRMLARDQRYEVLDIAASFLNREDSYDNGTIDYIHYNSSGHILIARAIYEYLVTNRIVPAYGRGENVSVDTRQWELRFEN
jgi:lysophospholipase L1-like esterase